MCLTTVLFDALCFGRDQGSRKLRRRSSINHVFLFFLNPNSRNNYPSKLNIVVYTTFSFSYVSRCTKEKVRQECGIQKFQDLVFFCKHSIGRLGNSPLRTEYNDLHDQEDYRMTFQVIPRYGVEYGGRSLLNSINVSLTFSFHCQMKFSEQVEVAGCHIRRIR